MRHRILLSRAQLRRTSAEPGRLTLGNEYRVIAETPLPQRLYLIHISEPTRLRRISYADFCLKKKK